MFFAMELQNPTVYISPHIHCLVKPSEQLIRDRKIGLRGEHVFFYDIYPSDPCEFEATRLKNS